jgi:hypothetical protein
MGWAGNITSMANELCFWTLSIVWCLKNKQNWGIKNIDKISQYTRPQNSHKDQLLTTEQLTWAHTHMNPWSKSDTGGNKWPSQWLVIGRVYCDILSIFLIPKFCLFSRHQTMDKVQKHNSFNTILISLVFCDLRGCIQKFTDWPPWARTANGTALCQ